MNNYLKIIIFILIGIAQLTLMPILGIRGIYPNIVLIGVVMLSLTDSEDDALLLAIIGGVVLDLSGPLPFGTNTLILTGIVLGLRFLITKYIPGTNLVITTFILFSTSLIFASLINVMSGHWPSILIIFEAFYCLLIGWIMYWQQRKTQNLTLTIKM